MFVILIIYVTILKKLINHNSDYNPSCYGNSIQNQ